MIPLLPPPPLKAKDSSGGTFVRKCPPLKELESLWTLNSPPNSPTPHRHPPLILSPTPNPVTDPHPEPGSLPSAELHSMPAPYALCFLLDRAVLREDKMPSLEPRCLCSHSLTLGSPKFPHSLRQEGHHGHLICLGC